MDIVTITKFLLIGCSVAGGGAVTAAGFLLLTGPSNPKALVHYTRAIACATTGAALLALGKGYF